MGINEDLFWEGEKQRSFLNFLIAVKFLLLTVCLISWHIG